MLLDDGCCVSVPSPEGAERTPTFITHAVVVAFVVKPAVVLCAHVSPEVTAGAWYGAREAAA